MARLARIVAPGVAHHVVQGGTLDRPAFCGSADYFTYRALLAQWCARAGVAVWAYCLAPERIHLLVVPAGRDGLKRAIGEAHRRYTCLVNAGAGRRGRLWRGRFRSYPLSGEFVLRAARLIECAAVTDGLAAAPWDWPWSSAAAHLAGRDDPLVTVAPLLALAPDWRALLDRPDDDDDSAALYRHLGTGRPLGDDAFIGRLEADLGRVLRRRRPGPRRHDAADAEASAAP